MSFSGSLNPIIISIDGNIGSGKSSVVEYLKKNFETYLKTCMFKKILDINIDDLKIVFLSEPVDEWSSFKDENNKTIIEKFYGDNKKYSFAFQMMAYVSRLSQLKKVLVENYHIIFTERSILTDKNVFAKMLYDKKNMEPIEYQIYNKWFNEFSINLTNMKIIYIKTSPEICDMRVKKRSRDGEIIPLSYLKDCHYYHETWLNNIDKLSKSIELLTINGNEETNTSVFINNNYYDMIISKIAQLIL